MAIHSSILAWRIPWSKETHRLQSMGSQSETWLSVGMYASEVPLLQGIHYTTSIPYYHMYQYVYQSNSKTKKEVIVLILLSKKLRFNEVI